MATITITRGSSLPNSATKSDFHNLVDTATGTITGAITGADIDPAAGIVGTQLSSGADILDTQLHQITTASKVHGSSITGLASLPAGAGVVPIANIATGTPTGAKFVRDDGTLQSPTLAASQAEMEAASSTTVAVTPGRAQYHPGMAKAWVIFNGTGTPAIRASHNVSSITDNGTGDYTINWTTAFSSVNYVVIGNCDNGSDPSTNAGIVVPRSAWATGSARILCFDNSGGAIDPLYVQLMAFGDQ